jgi:hypothetical protein
MAMFALQGCIFVSDSGPSKGVFQTTWTLTQGGAATTCATVGAASVSFLSTRASDSMGFDDVFTCSDMAGDTAPLTIDSYSISVSVLDANDQVLGQTPTPLSDNFDTCNSTANDTCFVTLPNIEFAF